MFLSLTDGLGEMVTRLEASLGGVALVTGRRVRAVEKRLGNFPARAAGSPAYTIVLDDGRLLHAGAVLFATPAYVSAELLQPLAAPVAAVLRRIPYVSTAAVTMAFRRAEIAHSLDGHGFVVARGEGVTITACTWISSKWPNRAPPDIALIRCYLGKAGREDVVGEDDARLTHLVSSDLRTTMGIDARPLFTRVARWTKAMPQYPAGHLERLVEIDAGLTDLPGLAVAGAGYRGIGIPDCIRQGTEAAHRLVEFLAPPAAQS
jgi:oxygen-dependent protoporphyrinogen oxidase